MQEKDAFTIGQFCEAHGISRTKYYELRHEGLAPREMRIGSIGVRISREAAAEWRRQMEDRAASEKTQAA